VEDGFEVVDEDEVVVDPEEWDVEITPASQPAAKPPALPVAADPPAPTVRVAQTPSFAVPAARPAAFAWAPQPVPVGVRPAPGNVSADDAASFAGALRRRPRWLKVGAALLLLAVGFALGRLTAPEPATAEPHAVPRPATADAHSGTARGADPLPSPLLLPSTTPPASVAETTSHRIGLGGDKRMR
jgi:hypothetical protein